MDLSLPVLVSVDQRDRYEVLLPGLSGLAFHGPSLASLLDDAALHLMETLPKEDPAAMLRYESSPHVELRKVKITAKIKGETKRDETTWSGRLSVILTRWPEDQFHVALVPRLSDEKFAVATPKSLEEALTKFVEAWVQKHDVEALESRTCRYHEYLEILSFDADLPTILPSKPAPPKKKKKSKKKKTPEAQAEEKKEKKRVLIAPAVLRSVATNLTHRAIDGRIGRAHLRDRLAEELKQQLEHEGTGILLVGPSGVGKTALVHEVVRRLASEPATLSERRDVWQVDGNRLISGMMYVGAWEHRVGAMVHELSLRQDILYVSDLPALAYTGRSAHSDTNVAEFLEPHLARGDLRIIGECTPERLLATREEAPGFFARFRIVQIDEMTEEQALLVLLHVVRDLGANEDLSVDPEALEAVLALTRRFQASRVQPGKSVALLTRVLSDHGEARRDGIGRRVIDRAKVIDVFGREAGLPRFVLWEKESRKQSVIEEFFSRRIIAQPKAIEAATDVVTLLEQGLNDPARPISTFLFVGPTGVGKTETAKALAEFLFGSPERMIRFDMSEMLHPETVARLFGDRFQPEGELTRRVHQQPFSVILLDEIEKAHPSIFDALLQVLGEGRLTNAAGRTVDFTNTVIIMTSNLGVREAGKRLGFETESSAALDAHYRGAAEKYFRPEFFNRIDRVVAFSPLTREAIAPLVGRLMESLLGRRGLRRSSILVDVDPALVDVIIDQGFDSRYGARSIKRMLEQRLAVPLARHLITRRGTELTLAELYPTADSLGMSLSRPQPRERKALPSLEPLRDWRAVEARIGRLSAMFEKFEKSDIVYALRAEHSALVARYDAAGEERLQLLARILEDFSHTHQDSLRRKLEDFYHQHLERVLFEEGMVDDESSLHRRDYEKTKTQVAPDARPLRAERPPLRRDVAAEVEQLEIAFGALIYQIKSALEPPSRSLLIRALPVPEGKSGWAEQVTHAIAASFGRWGSSQLFQRLGDRWVECRRSDKEYHPTAVELSGAGLLDLIGPELGYWALAEEVGPDLITRLVRLEEVGDGGDPAARLEALDRAIEAGREQRRLSPQPTEVLPELPIARWFRDDKCHDPETDIELTLTTLEAQLHQLAMRRVFSTLHMEAEPE